MDSDTYCYANDNQTIKNSHQTTSFNIPAKQTPVAVSEQTKQPNRSEKLKNIIFILVAFITITTTIIMAVMVTVQFNQLNEDHQTNTKQVVQALKNQTYRLEARFAEVEKQVKEAKTDHQTNMEQVVVALQNQTYRLKEIEAKLVAVQKQSAEDLVTNFTTNCSNLAKLGIRTNGVNNQTTEVYCDMETDGGDWTVIQRRTSNDVDFYRDWQSYVDGFGNTPCNFWLGLETIHEITSSRSYQLRVDLEDFSNNTAYALYSSFSIGNETSNYQSHVSGYNGTAGDSMTYHNNQPFSTKDRDNDALSSNCAVEWHGAWWYKDCYFSNLNGKYFSSGVVDGQSINWVHWKNQNQSLKQSEMKIKPN